MTQECTPIISQVAQSRYPHSLLSFFFSGQSFSVFFPLETVPFRSANAQYPPWGRILTAADFGIESSCFCCRLPSAICRLSHRRGCRVFSGWGFWTWERHRTVWHRRWRVALSHSVTEATGYDIRYRTGEEESLKIRQEKGIFRDALWLSNSLCHSLFAQCPMAK